MSTLSHPHRKGNIIIALVLIFTVIAIVLAIDNFKKERFPMIENPASSDEMYPWQEHKRLITDGQEINTNVGNNMVDISDGLNLTITVEETQYSDQMGLYIAPNGTASGGWTTDYVKKAEGQKMNYNITSSFEGNIDPACTYFDQSGEDYSKLFVIARGQATIVAVNMKNSATGMGGDDIFVSGWIEPDGKAHGQIGIMLSGENKIYKWHGKKAEPLKF